MIHILLFDEDSRASQYGIGTYIKQISAIITQMQGIHLSVILSRSKEKEFCVRKQNNIDCYFIPDVLNDNDSEYEIQRYYKNIWYLIYPYFLQFKNKKVILHLNYYQHSYLIDGFYRYFPDGKSCFTLHYMDWCFKIMGNYTCLNNVLQSAVANNNDTLSTDVLTIYGKEKCLFEKLDKVICLSKNTGVLLKKVYMLPEEKISTLYNGLRDDVEYLRYEDKSRIRKSLFIGDDEKIILFVGRLDVIKGVDILIAAFKQVLSDYPTCRLVLVGDGFYSYYLRECDPIWSKITFMGRLNKDELYNLYQITYIGVLPSFHEQCSYVAIEMMMHGIPLITSTSTGLLEMVEDGISGLQVPIIEYENHVELRKSDLSNRILTLLMDQPMREQMGMNARLRYERYYTLEALKLHLYKFYNSLVL